MAKTKQPSAAQRREEERQQRLRANSQNNRNRNANRRRKKNNPWPLIIGIVVIVAIVIGAFFVIVNQNKSAVTKSQNGAYQSIASIDPKLLAQVGPGSAKNAMHGVSGAGKLTGTSGKPEFLYMGAEYCPYCAAERWGVIIALNRFGQFTQAPQPLTSGEGNVPTFSFHGAKYTSQYIDTSLVEINDNAQPQPGALDTPTAQQQQLLAKYDSPPYVTQQQTGGIPFIDIANQQVSQGAYYDPTLLTGQSYQQIASQIKDPNSDISRNILGTANDLTAAICASTNNQPSNVCTANPIPSIESGLPKASVVPGGPQIAAAAGSNVMDVRKRA
ncbi:MAG TPA: DUF929 family protein [Ktedonobacteraceae bacterium]|nr:DUF929 family protein [Ktedonobacteraceae bacterium]